jgi:hypothetical protein
MKKLFILITFLGLFSFTRSYSQATFSFTNTGTTPQMDTAITYAGTIWGQYLISSVPIKIHLYYMNLFGATLAITIPNGERDFSTAPVDSVWYPSCLANSLEGTELNPGEDDINIFFDNNANWYFGTNAICPAGKYDFVTTLLHEIGHGLGFLSLAKLDGDTLGSWGMITASDLTPLVTTFPFPDLQGKHSIFSHYMQNGTAQSIVDTSLFPNPSNILGNQFKSNAVYFAGPLAMAANSGNPVRIYAPTVYAKGSSMEHLNEASFPPNNPSTLMTPFEGTSEEHHAPGPINIAILKDIGWNIVPGIGIENVLTDSRIHVFPNPVVDFANIRLEESVENENLEIFDLSGRVVFNTKITAQKGAYTPIDLSYLSTGLYTLRIRESSLKLMKN